MKIKDAIVEKLLFIQAEIREVKNHLYALKKYIARRHKHNVEKRVAINNLKEQRNKHLQGKGLK
jgi:FtsZ-binding cell division protein ZapB